MKKERQVGKTHSDRLQLSSSPSPTTPSTSSASSSSSKGSRISLGSKGRSRCWRDGREDQVVLQRIVAFKSSKESEFLFLDLPLEEGRRKRSISWGNLYHQVDSKRKEETYLFSSFRDRKSVV